MSYCPEDGTKMDAQGRPCAALADYICPECKTIWQYDAEKGCYRVIEPWEQIA